MGFDLGIACIPGGIATDHATAPGFEHQVVLTKASFQVSGKQYFFVYETTCMAKYLRFNIQQRIFDTASLSKSPCQLLFAHVFEQMKKPPNITCVSKRENNLPHFKLVTGTLSKHFGHTSNLFLDIRTH